MFKNFKTYYVLSKHYFVCSNIFKLILRFTNLSRFRYFLSDHLKILNSIDSTAVSFNPNTAGDRTLSPFKLKVQTPACQPSPIRQIPSFDSQLYLYVIRSKIQWKMLTGLSSLIWLSSVHRTRPWNGFVEISIETIQRMSGPTFL